MNICVVILILKMEENKQHFWHIMLYYFKKGQNTMKAHKKIVQYVEKVLRLIKYVESVANFRAGDFSLDNSPHWGRPVESDRDQIKMWIENNQCYTTWEIAVLLKISKSIKSLLKMTNVPFILRNKKSTLTFFLPFKDLSYGWNNNYKFIQWICLYSHHMPLLWNNEHRT